MKWGRSRDGRTEAAITATDSLPVTDEMVTWALRLLIGREPTGEAEIALHRQHATLGQLRLAMMGTAEFRSLCDATAPRRRSFVSPGFLQRPPAHGGIPWVSGPPTLAAPVSQLCTAAQFEEPEFREAIAAMRLHPGAHRKLWEHAYIVAVLTANGAIGPGKRALGFGCGRERIPALLAARGTEVLATDAPEEETFNQGWATTRQHAAAVSDLFRADIVDRDTFDRLVAFRAVDMNAIPADLADRFDCCWSSCSLEHLGSLRHGLDFIEASLATLRPGGIAVHTTEFNLTSNQETIETPALSIYRRRDIESLLARLVAQGHDVLPLKLDAGDALLDQIVDVPPYGLPHLKLAVGNLTLTSIGVAVRRRA
jgi:2-polyprenyl-3-methyl-5-hydroxy-6-metoxy-1,4-benzoquinol methylase